MGMTPAQMIEAVTRNLAKNTGKTVAQWSALLARSGPSAPKEQYAWLRREYGVGHVAARILSGQLEAYAQPDALVDAQYAGKHAALRPLYDAVVKAARKLGKDVTAQPCKTYVPLHRKVTFAILKPGPGRLDVGLALGEAGGRLKKAGRLGSDRITHKIEVRSKKDVSAALSGWLKKAYQLAG